MSHHNLLFHGIPTISLWKVQGKYFPRLENERAKWFVYPDLLIPSPVLFSCVPEGTTGVVGCKKKETDVGDRRCGLEKSLFRQRLGDRSHMCIYAHTTHSHTSLSSLWVKHVHMCTLTHIHTLSSLISMGQACMLCVHTYIHPTHSHTCTWGWPES